MENIEGLFAVMARSYGLIFGAPVFNARQVPLPVKAGLGYVLALVVAPVAARSYPGTGGDLTALGRVVVGEMVVGLAMGFMVHLIFMAVQVGGQLLDMEMGFGIVSVIQPGLDVSLPLMGSLQYLLAVLIFLLMDGHHVVLHGMVDGYNAIPIGAASMSPATVKLVIAVFGKMFRVAVEIVAPVMVALFASSVALGLISRAVPQMNVFVMGLPLKIAVGIAVTIVVLPAYLVAVRVLFNSMYSDIGALLDTMRGG